MAITKILVGSGSEYEGLSESIDDRGQSGQLILLCDDWSARKTDLEAAGYTYGSQTFPGNTTLRLRRWRFAGYGETGTGVGEEYTHAIITLDYSADYDELDGTPQWSFDSSQDVLTLGDDAVYASDGSAVGSDVSRNKVIPYTDMSARMPVVQYPIDAINAVQGKVNQYAWIPPGLLKLFAPETVLFVGASSEPYYHPLYGKIWCATYNFRAREYSHNAVERFGIYGSYWDYVIPAIYQGAVFTGLGL